MESAITRIPSISGGGLAEAFFFVNAILSVNATLLSTSTLGGLANKILSVLLLSMDTIQGPS